MAENDGKPNEVAEPDALAQVDALKARLNQTSGALEEANRRNAQTAATADAALHEAAAARAAIEQVTKTAQTSELERANGEMTGLKTTYKEAFQAGDSDAMADAQAKMARLGGKIDRLETEAAAAPKPADNGGRAVRPAAPDPVEQFISSRTPQTAAWLRQHPEVTRGFMNDPKYNAKVRSADAAWEAEGKAKDTHEYFDHMERSLGLVQDPAPRAAADDPPAKRPGADKGGAVQTGAEGTASTLTPAGSKTDPLPDGRRGPPQAGRGRTPPVAAPPNRDGAPALSGRGSGDGVKRITPEMQRWAAMMYPNGGIEPEEYFDEYRRLVDAGEINDRFGQA